MASAWNAPFTQLLNVVSWNAQRRLTRFTPAASHRGPDTGMPRAPTGSQTPMKRISVSCAYVRRHRVDAVPVGFSVLLRYRTHASLTRSAHSLRRMPELRTRPDR